MNIKTIDLKTMPELKGKESMIKFRNIGLQSENYISFTDSESAMLLVYSAEKGTIDKKSMSKNVYALMHPRQNILSVYAEGLQTQLQVYDMDMKAKIRTWKSKDCILYARWISDEKIAVVTSEAIFHIHMNEKVKPDKKIAALDVNIQKTLREELGQIIGYYCNSNETWTALSMIYSPDKGATIQGRNILYLPYESKSQMLESYGFAFGNIRVRPHQPEALLICTLKRSQSKMSIIIHEISQMTNLNRDKIKASYDLPADIMPAKDFPIEIMYIQVNPPKIVAVTRMGLFLTFDPIVGHLIEKKQILNNGESFLIAKKKLSKTGFVAISKQGFYFNVTLESQSESPSKVARTQSTTLPLPTNIANALVSLVTSQNPPINVLSQLTSSLSKNPQDKTIAAAWLKQFQNHLNVSPQSAFIYARIVARSIQNHLVPQIANILLAKKLRVELTEFVLQFLCQPNPANQKYQTAVIELNIQQNPSVVATVFDLGLLTQFDKTKISKLCEGKGLYTLAMVGFEWNKVTASKNNQQIQRAIKLCAYAASQTKNPQSRDTYLNYLQSILTQKNGNYNQSTVFPYVIEAGEIRLLKLLSAKIPQVISYLIKQNKLQHISHILKTITAPIDATVALETIINEKDQVLVKCLGALGFITSPQLLFIRLKNSNRAELLSKWVSDNQFNDSVNQTEMYKYLQASIVKTGSPMASSPVASPILSQQEHMSDFISDNVAIKDSSATKKEDQSGGFELL